MGDEPKKIKSDTHDFSQLIDGGYLYIDKTAVIQKLLTAQHSYFFLARPRRFGKSLLLSTIQEIFQGDTRRFENLMIGNSDFPYEFKKSHVIRISLSTLGIDPEFVNESLADLVNMFSATYGFDSKINNCGTAIFKLIYNLYHSFKNTPLLLRPELFAASDTIPENQMPDDPRVVVLIDEYDYQLIANIHNQAKLGKIKDILNSFFSSIKEATPMIRFLLVTGITKFSEISAGSGMNNLVDITYNQNFSDICGFTKHEISNSLKNNLSTISEEFNDASEKKNIAARKNHSKINEIPKITSQDILNSLVDMYDGYSWDGRIKIFNPYSTLKFFENKQIAGYWYESGGPNFLKQLNLIRQDFFKIFDRNITYTGTIPIQELHNTSPQTAMLHTGYLTVNKIEDVYPADTLASGNSDYHSNLRITPYSVVNQTRNFHLIIPNKEVRLQFAKEFLIDTLYSNLSETSKSELFKLLEEFTSAFCNCDAKTSEEKLSAIFSSYPFKLHISRESYYQTIMFGALSFANGTVTSEKNTVHGITDLILELHNDTVIIAEVKYDKTNDNIQNKENGTYTKNQTSSGTDLNRNEPLQNTEDATLRSKTAPAATSAYGPTKDKIKKNFKLTKITEKINRLLDRGLLSAFKQIEQKEYAAEFIHKKRNVWIAAVAIVDKNHVKIKFQKVDYSEEK
ncbi:MAG: AAA family ATPase [Deltaproteobacteria bacterium]|jgi:hypothetical protein|nr:AAA family ATPase [Deltaproteobacteria bacterium]